VLPVTASAAALADLIRPPKGVASVTVVDSSGAGAIAGGADVSRDYFEIGSLTKTMTATLLARLVVDRLIRLETTVGELLGRRAGGAQSVTMLELATHTSGLPRIAPNAMRFPFWPRDPYRFYDEGRLYEGLQTVELAKRGTIQYSNLGFDLLGHCLATAMAERFEVLLMDQVLWPAGMNTARCQPCSRRGLLRGSGSLLLGGRSWHQKLAGAGGVDCTIEDLAAWVVANTHPSSSPLQAAVELCHVVHRTDAKAVIGLSWHFRNNFIWHNGGTGTFQGVVAFKPSRIGVGALASLGPGTSYELEGTILKWVATDVM
jgi:CubicO group peptidase (beta-lactamase class C family)